MPTYQYACTECQHSFEQVQSFSDDALTVCPRCRGRLRKVYNAVGVVFKGSGFYRNDSRPGGADGPDAKPSSDGSGTGDPAKGDAKPADTPKVDAAGAGSATKATAAGPKPSDGGGTGTSTTTGTKGSTSAA